MKKILSLLMAFALVLSLVPSFAFAASEYDVLIDFTKTTNANNNMAVTGLVGTAAGYEIVTAESCSTVYDQRQAGGVQQFSLTDYAWIASSTTTSNHHQRKVTIEVPVSKAGYYNMKILGATWHPGGVFYFYVDGEYAGLYNFDSKGRENSTTIAMSTEKTLNTLYLDPGEDGKVKIMFATAVQSASYSQTRALLKTLKLDYVGSEPVTYQTFNHTIPETVYVGEQVEFSANAVMSDGSVFRANGYEVGANGLAVASTDNSVSATAGDGVKLTKTSNDITYDGVYEGVFSCTSPGEKTITLTAMIDGEPKSFPVTVNAIESTEAAPITLNFGKGAVTPSGVASEWKVDPTYGWAVDTTLTRDTAFPSASAGENYLKLSQNYNADNYSAWWWYSDVSSNNSSGARKTTFSVKTQAPIVAGDYKVKVTGGKCADGGRMFVYVNDKFAGVYDCYDPEATDASTVTICDEVTLNTVSITPETAEGEAPYARITIYNAEYAANKRATNVISSITLEPVKTAPTVEDVVLTVPETVKVGESGDVSAYVLMSDGSKHYFNGIKRYAGSDSTYLCCSVKDTDNALYIATSANLTFVGDYESDNTKYTKVGVFTNPGGVATGKITATDDGVATVTVSGKINGVTIPSVQKTVTVPYDGAGELVENKKVTFAAFAEVGGTVTDDKEVKRVDIGSSVEVTATPDEGYEFAYWRNASGNHLSSEATETFTVNTNTSVIAVFDKVAVDEGDTTVPVYLYNENSSLIEKKDVEKGSKFSDAIKGVKPTLTGFNFDKWSISGDTVVNSILRAVALYTADTTEYTVKAGNKEITGAYGTEVTVTGSDNFKAWKLGDNIVSYDKDYSFYIWGDITLTEVTEGEVTVSPTVAINKIGDNYFIAYNVPTGYTLIEAGIVFADTGIPTVGSFYSKAVAKEGTGQFTAKKGDGNETAARGYVMFRDSKDNIAVIYAD